MTMLRRDIMSKEGACGYYTMGLKQVCETICNCGLCVVRGQLLASVAIGVREFAKQRR
jgi:hypothetical protein